MKQRHLGKALIALLAMVAALGLSGTPVSATTDVADAELTAGFLVLKGADDSTIHTQDLSDETSSTECESSNNDATMEMSSTTHPWEFSSRSHTSVIIAGVHFTVEMEIGSSGTSSTTGTLTGTAWATLKLTPNSSQGCDVVHAAPCFIDVIAIDLTGTHDMLSSIDASDEAEVSGDNGPGGDFGFEVSVTGNCGALFAADDGSASIDGVVVHALT